MPDSPPTSPESPQPARPRVVSPADVRRAGLFAAIAIGLLITVGLTVIMVFRRSAQTGPNLATTPASTPASPPTNLGASDAPPAAPTATAAPPPDGPTPVAGGLSDGFRAGKSRLAFLDQSDPGRTSAVMSWQDLAPTGQGNSAVTEPRGLMFLRDGGVALITASRGTFFTPQGKSEPEAGRFEGGVTLELFDAPLGRAVDLVADSPSLVATTQTLLFEATESTVSTPDRFVAESAGFAIEGVGSRVVFDQLAQGIARAEFNKVDRVRIWPGGRPGLAKGTALGSLAQEARRREAGTTTPQGSGPPGTLAPGQNAPGDIDQTQPVPNQPAVPRRIYRAVVEDDVVVRQGRSTGTTGPEDAAEPRLTLSAARAEAWLTTQNNRLAEGAIAPLDAGLLPIANEPPPQGAPPRGADASPAQPQTPANAPPIIATWSGRMVITPVASMPEGFGGNLAALRLTGGAAGPARVVDRVPGTQSGPAATTIAVAAPIIEYGATTRTLDLTGTRASNVVLDAQGLGLLTCTKAKLDASAGRFDVQGPGELTALTASKPTAPGPTAPEQDADSLLVTWSRSLALIATGTAGARSLRTIEARGAVQAQTAELTAQADRAVVLLAPSDARTDAPTNTPTIPQSSGDARPRIESVELVGTASAAVRLPLNPQPTPQPIKPEPQKLAGDRLLVAMTRDAQGRDRPTRVEVTGNALATASGLRVSAPAIHASLAPGPDGRVEVVSAKAGPGPSAAMGGQAVVTGEGGLQAFADSVEADPRSQTAILRGAPARVQRQGAELAAPVIALDQRQQIVTIDAPGTLNAISQERTGPTSRPVRVSATWGTNARMDNRAGTVEATGATRVTIAAGDDELNTIKGERVELGLDGPAEPGERRVQRVRVTGGQGPNGEPASASVEHRRFNSAPTATRALARLVYLQGPSVEADLAAGTLDVRGAGKLLVDQPQDGAIAAAAPLPNSPNLLAGTSLTQARGTSLFSWTGSLRMDRATGTLALRQGVQLTHRPADTQARLTLDCDELDAFLTQRQTLGTGDDPMAGLSADLQRVEARGSPESQIRASELAPPPSDTTDPAQPPAPPGPARELTALNLLYDASAGVMRAAGTDESLATFLDGAQPTPVRAREIQWDLRAGRLSAQGLAPITIAPMR
jgi:hypothetical protein